MVEVGVRDAAAVGQRHGASAPTISRPGGVRVADSRAVRAGRRRGAQGASIAEASARRSGRGVRERRSWPAPSPSGGGSADPERTAGSALEARACRTRCAPSQVLTRGTPPRLEGCRPASRGYVLALMTLRGRLAGGARARQPARPEFLPGRGTSHLRPVGCPPGTAGWGLPGPHVGVLVPGEMRQFVEHDQCVFRALVAGHICIPLQVAEPERGPVDET